MFIVNLSCADISGIIQREHCGTLQKANREWGDSKQNAVRFIMG
jgi:hypothetical protein